MGDPATTDPDHDPDLAADLVRRATAIAAGTRAEGLDTDRKTGFSDIVTSADLAAERFVTDTLERLRPDDGLLGEEGAARASSSGRTWVVDPVDGTWNFANHIASWCSAVALVRGDPEELVPVLGAVHRPDLDETWLGGPDLPTRCNGVPVEPLRDRPLAEVTLAGYIHPSTLADPDVREPFLALVRGAATVRMLGSASVDLTSSPPGASAPGPSTRWRCGTGCPARHWWRRPAAPPPRSPTAATTGDWPATGSRSVSSASGCSGPESAGRAPRSLLGRHGVEGVVVPGRRTAR